MFAPGLIQGRWLGAEDFEALQRLIGEHPHWSRRRLSIALCEALNWRTASVCAIWFINTLQPALPCRIEELKAVRLQTHAESSPSLAHPITDDCPHRLWR
jgi:hypothetical protein